MSELASSETLITLAQVIRESAELRAWFTAVAKADVGVRACELARMAAEMKLAGEDPRLISATQLLGDRKFFAAATAALSLTPKS